MNAGVLVGDVPRVRISLCGHVVETKKRLLLGAERRVHFPVGTVGLV